VGKPNEAAQVFDTLTAKFPEEGKKVLPKMARIMYESGKYDKAIAAVKKIFEKNPSETPVSSLRWIAKTLSDCGGKHPKEGAELALRACVILQKKLANPDYEKWLGKQKAKELAGNQKELDRWMRILKEQINVFTATAAFWAGDYQKSEDALTDVLANEKTPYFFEASFQRAAARRKLKKYKLALDDYAQVSKAILGDKKLPRSLFFKNQCLTGDTFVEMKEYGKASNAYSMAAMAALVSDENDQDAEETVKEAGQKQSPAELKKQSKWMQHALFMLVSCLKASGKTKEMDKYVAAYKKSYRQGKFQGQIANPPPPEAALQAAGTK